MEIKTFPLGPLQTNCYVLAGSDQAVAVDPGGDPAAVLNYLSDNNLKLTHILNTHLHFDHTYGNKVLSEATGAPIICSEEDLYLLESELGGGGTFGLPPVEEYTPQTIATGEHSFAGFACNVFHTPGHSSGSYTYYFAEAKAAFVGDLIFYRSIGRTDFPGGDLDMLKNSVKQHIFTLPPETLLLSGHGPETSVGDEMNHNPFFSEF
ncbi:MBL fold metallo-hydrolase [Pseudodesulfovibrio sp. zrk46]|uniref:MBL fold metallo-hydrolase n=1 Tax=Pseudodesulfovibrio sp. zrk46 TaxID=2725288 RepID=UPI001449F9BD|nr:MBL fold metallo-hydrolase [Pseudodesulfovibrio sp. zrk46]QJB57002.1 MBL fold metallo-hydrolase [Pseudodesulfovibrio sp. zrk46]